MANPPLWAPWRIDYILGDKPDGCVFCGHARAEPSDDNLVLARGRHCFVVLNRHPYAAGHLLVLPYAHLADVNQLALDAWRESTELLRLCTEVLGELLSPQGINLGMNLGEAAGAGIPGHLHWHVVPRWSGDTNFMPVVADLAVIPEHLRVTWRKLRPAMLRALDQAGITEEIT